MKRFVKIIIALTFLLAIAYSVAYIVIAKISKDEITKFSETQSSLDVNIKCNNLDINGFPFNFILNCQKLNIIDGDARFEIDGVEAKYSIFSPLRAQISVTSPIKYSNEFFASKQELRWKSLKTEIALNGWQLKQATIKAEEFEYVDLLIGEYQILSAKNIALYLLENKKQYDLVNELVSPFFLVNVEGFNFTNFQINEGRLAVETIISNLPADIRSWRNERILQKWQQNQGKIIINRFNANDESKMIDVTGALGIGGLGFLAGDLKVQSKNIIELIAPNFPVNIQPLIFGSKAQDGSYSQKLSTKNGTIYSGLLPIGELPALF